MNDHKILITTALEHSAEKLFGPYETQKYVNETSRILTYSDCGLNVDIIHSYDGGRDRVIKMSIRSPLRMHRSEKFDAKTPWFYILINRDIKTADVNKELHVEIFTMWKPSEVLAMHQLRDLQTVKATERDFKKIMKVHEPEDDTPREKQEETQIEEESSDMNLSISEPVVYQTRSTKSPKRIRFSEQDDTIGSDSEDVRSEIIKNSKRGHGSSLKTKLLGKNAPKLRHNHDERLPSFIPQNSMLVGGIGGSMHALPKSHIVGSYLMYTDTGPSWVLPSLPLSGKNCEQIKIVDRT